MKNVRLQNKRIKCNGSTRVLVDVTNTGKRAGSEVVQLYVRDLVSSVTRPIKELKGFQKVTLNPGETTTVALEITGQSLAFYDINMEYVVEPGDFAVMVGNSSRDEDLQQVILRVNR
jgi:beta-glucosidase